MKIIIFITLKLIEITALVFVPWWVGGLASSFFGVEGVLDTWLLGDLIIVGFLFITVILIVFFNLIIKDFIKWNWHLAERVMEWLK